LPQGLKSIGSGAFTASKIKSLTIPNTVETIESSAFAFDENARALDSLIFESGGTADLEIMDSAFEFANITTVELPYRTKQLGREFGYGSFFQNDLLKTVHIKRPSSDTITEAFRDPFAIFDATTLNFVPNPNITIFVPDSDSVIAYQSANYFSAYKDQIKSAI